MESTRETFTKNGAARPPVRPRVRAREPIHGASLVGNTRSGTLRWGAKTHRMFRSFLITVAAMAFATPALAQLSPSDEGAGTKLGMRELNNSGQAGEMTLFARGPHETLVVLKLASAEGRTEAAHIHRGHTESGQENSCDNLDPKPTYVLHPVVNGRSSTLVKASEDKLLSGNYVINVHSQSNLAHYVSCGELYK